MSSLAHRKGISKMLSAYDDLEPALSAAINVTYRPPKDPTMVSVSSPHIPASSSNQVTTHDLPLIGVEEAKFEQIITSQNRSSNITTEEQAMN